MGTHPIFESDFDCLTDIFRMLASRLCSARPLLASRTSSLRLATKPMSNTRLLRPKLFQPVRHYGGGSVGISKFIIIYVFTGGIALFFALSSQVIGTNIFYVYYAILAIIA